MNSMTKWNLKTILLAIWLLFSLEGIAGEDDKSERQAQFMAVYLLHFSNFIEWPREEIENKTSFDICVLGNGNVNPFIKALETEKVKDQLIRVIFTPSAEQLAACKIVYVDKENIEQFLEIEPILRGSEIVFVSDKKGFIEQGGTIEYFVENNKLRFAINMESAREKGLQVSSKLLMIAKVLR
jgi:hypothetical protein